MPPRLREAFLLREWQGLSYAEIAERLDTSRSAVETLIFRARRHLAAELRKAQNALTLGPLATWLRGLFGTSAAVRGAGVLALATGVVAATTVATTPAKQAPARARPQHHGARADIAPVLAAQLPQGRASVVRKRVGGAAAPAAPESAVPGLAPTGTGGATNGSTAATAPSAPTTTAAGLPSLPAAAPRRDGAGGDSSGSDSSGGDDAHRDGAGRDRAAADDSGGDDAERDDSDGDSVLPSALAPLRNATAACRSPRWSTSESAMQSSETRYPPLRCTASYSERRSASRREQPTSWHSQRNWPGSSESNCSSIEWVVTFTSRYSVDFAASIARLPSRSCPDPWMTAQPPQTCIRLC
jgi:hypothetical protein